jgi:hypothetical protein
MDNHVLTLVEASQMNPGEEPLGVLAVHRRCTIRNEGRTAAADDDPTGIMEQRGYVGSHRMWPALIGSLKGAGSCG